MKHIVFTFIPILFGLMIHPGRTEANCNALFSEENSSLESLPELAKLLNQAAEASITSHSDTQVDALTRRRKHAVSFLMTSVLIDPEFSFTNPRLYLDRWFEQSQRVPEERVEMDARDVLVTLLSHPTIVEALFRTLDVTKVPSPTAYLSSRWPDMTPTEKRPKRPLHGQLETVLDDRWAKIQFPPGTTDTKLIKDLTKARLLGVLGDKRFQEDPSGYMSQLMSLETNYNFDPKSTHIRTVDLLVFQFLYELGRLKNERDKILLESFAEKAKEQEVLPPPEGTLLSFYSN